MLELCCLRLGDPPERAFLVEIDGEKTVSYFRKTIKEENKHAFAHLDAPSLKLSLVSIPYGDIKAPIQDLTQFKAQPMLPPFRLNQLFPEPPKYLHIHVLVQADAMVESQRPSKRIRMDDSLVDVSEELLKKWNVPHQSVLDIKYLKGYLDAPLDPEEKIPISGVEWQALLVENSTLRMDKCFPKDLEILFTKSENEVARVIWYSLLNAIVRRPPESSGTEDSFHSFWDDNILRTLLICLDEPRSIRNSNKGSNTGSMRPDVGLFLGSRCLFRGEEKKPTFMGKHPRQELIDNARWVYDPAPYVLGYYAAGSTVTIVAIQSLADARGEKKITLKDIIHADLSRRQERIRHAARMIRLVKILRALELVIECDVDADMFIVNLDDGKSIEYLANAIRKTYPLQDQSRFSSLVTIYNHLKTKGVPNVDQMVKSYSRDGLVVELKPRGIDTGPRSSEDVKNAVMNVLEALKVLHTTEPQIFHRDIRWANVIQSMTNPNEWFLIDWEDAAVALTKAATNLDASNHAPQVFQDGHGAEVDLWGVGRLITIQPIANLPRELLDFGERMECGYIVTAEQGLEELKLVRIDE